MNVTQCKSSGRIKLYTLHYTKYIRSFKKNQKMFVKPKSLFEICKKTRSKSVKTTDIYVS